MYQNLEGTLALLVKKYLNLDSEVVQGSDGPTGERGESLTRATLGICSAILEAARKVRSCLRQTVEV